MRQAQKRPRSCNDVRPGAFLFAPNDVDTMILLTRLNGHPLLLNADLIEAVEPTPDTVITMTSGNKLIVRDSMDDIQAKVVDFRRRIHAPNVS